MHYAWAIRNQSPTCPSMENHRERLTGFLAVDIQRGNTDVQFRDRGTGANVLFVITLMVLVWLQRGCRHITLVLDNVKTHRKKTQEGVLALLAELALQCPDWEALQNLELNFMHTPAYSPALNPAEYLIHRIRQQALYHLPCQFTVEAKSERVRAYVARGSPFNAQQMERLLNHIYRLPHTHSSFSYKLE